MSAVAADTPAPNRLRTYAQLVRLPNVFTALADITRPSLAISDHRFAAELAAADLGIPALRYGAGDGDDLASRCAGKGAGFKAVATAADDVVRDPFAAAGATSIGLALRDDEDHGLPVDQGLDVRHLRRGRSAGRIAGQQARRQAEAEKGQAVSEDHEGVRFTLHPRAF